MSKRKQDFKEYFSSEECFHNGEKLHIEEYLRMMKATLTKNSVQKLLNNQLKKF